MSGQALALDGRALDAGHRCTAPSAGGPPLCDDVPSTPVLDWAPVTGAGGYLVYLAEDPDFTNRVLDPFTKTVNSRWTPTETELLALADNESGQAYYWYIRPCVRVRPNPVNCGPDPISDTDAATNAFRKVSPKVVRTSRPPALRRPAPRSPSRGRTTETTRDRQPP